MPELKPRFGRKPGGGYTDGDLQDYVKAMPMRPGWLFCGSYVLNADIDTVWDVIFADNAQLTLESVKSLLEVKLNQHL